MVEQDDTTPRLGAVPVDEAKLKAHVDEAVGDGMEEKLNTPLDAEAGWLCRTQRYKRSPERADTRAGHHERQLETKAGGVATESANDRCHYRQLTCSREQ